MTLHYIALHCIVLYRIALNCVALHSELDVLRRHGGGVVHYGHFSPECAAWSNLGTAAKGAETLDKVAQRARAERELARVVALIRELARRAEAAGERFYFTVEASGRRVAVEVALPRREEGAADRHSASRSPRRRRSRRKTAVARAR